MLGENGKNNVKNGIKQMEEIKCRMITIDSSTKKSGIAIFDNGIYKEHILLDYEKDNNMDSRFLKMTTEIMKILKTYEPDIIYIEEVVVDRNMHSIRFLARLIGVVYGYSLLKDCEFNTIRPTEWRSQLNFVQGTGHKRDDLKQQAIDYVKKEFNLDVNDDEADAICIGLAVIKKFEKLMKKK
jgi:Holliday junction resolvasome RuvABC endonuclease subunit